MISTTNLPRRARARRVDTDKHGFFITADYADYRVAQLYADFSVSAFAFRRAHKRPEFDSMPAEFQTQTDFFTL
jgi:hypothetical protein